MSVCKSRWLNLKENQNDTAKTNTVHPNRHLEVDCHNSNWDYCQRNYAFGVWGNPVGILDLTMRRSKLSPISKHKLQQYKDEELIRIELCERAGGEWHPVTSSMVGGYCKGGLCECGCNRPPDWKSIYRLEPHEKNHRGIGGKLSLGNTIMVRRDCHERLQHPKIRDCHN